MDDPADYADCKQVRGRVEILDLKNTLISKTRKTHTYNIRTVFIESKTKDSDKEQCGSRESHTIQISKVHQGSVTTERGSTLMGHK